MYCFNHLLLAGYSVAKSYFFFLYFISATAYYSRAIVRTNKYGLEVLFQERNYKETQIIYLHWYLQLESEPSTVNQNVLMLLSTNNSVIACIIISGCYRGIADWTTLSHFQ